MAPRSKVSQKPKAAPQSKAVQPCIRCPSLIDPSTEQHHVDFNQCQKEYPTNDETWNASQLWWGFTSDPDLNAAIDLTNDKNCKTLLDHAKNIGDKWALHMSPEDAEEFQKNGVEEKAKAKFKGKLVTKEMLETAVRVLFPPPAPKVKGKMKVVEKPEAAAEEMAGEEAMKPDTGALGAAKESEPDEAIPLPVIEHTAEALHKLKIGTTEAVSEVATKKSQETPQLEEASSTTLTEDDAAWEMAPSRSRASQKFKATSSTMFGGASVPTGSAASSFRKPGTTLQGAPRPGIPLQRPTDRGGPAQQNQKAIDEKDAEARRAGNIQGAPVPFDPRDSLQQVDRHAKELAHSSLRARGEDATDDTLQRESEQIKKTYGLRKGFGHGNGNAGQVVTNYMQLNPPANIYVYQVDIRKREGGKIVKVTKSADKKALMDLVSRNVPQLKASGKNVKHWVTDGDLIWSTVDLFAAPGTTRPPPAPGVCVVRLLNQNGLVLQYQTQCGEWVQAHSVDITFKEFIADPSNVIQLCEIDASTSYRQSTLAILLRGLNAFLTDAARSIGQGTGQTAQQADRRVFTSGQKCFNSDTARGLDESTQGDPLRCLDGFFLSSRPGNNRMLLNVNTAFSAFFTKSQTVEQFLSYPAYNRRSDSQKASLLQGLHVQVDPIITSSTTRSKFVYGVQGRGKNGKHMIKVAKGTAQRDREAQPLAADKLEIKSWQPFRGQLNGPQTDQMIDYARGKPSDNHQRITGRGLELFRLDGANQAVALSRFGMSIGTSMLQVPARWLDAPAIQYRAGGHSTKNVWPHEAAWNLLDDPKFAIPGNKLGELFYLNTSNMQDEDLRAQLRTLQKKLEKHNVLPESGTGSPFRTLSHRKFDPWQVGKAEDTSDFEAQVEYVFSFFNNDNANTPILVVIEEKDYDLYAYIKRVAELRRGLSTIFATRTRLTYLEPQVASNIASKYNIKIGGTNHVLDSGFEALGQESTIVIGADVTHPGPGAYSGTPSIAAVVGSTDDDFMHFPGSMRLQRSRKEFIVELGDMVKERLIDWAEKNEWKLPDRMLFYRDGVSESQYEKIRTFEIPQIQHAFNWARDYIEFIKRNGFDMKLVMDSHRPPWPVPAGKDDGSGNDLFLDETAVAKQVSFELTYVVVGKRHNTRFYPVKGAKMINTYKDKKGLWKVNGNVTPGFVVDQVITHPYSFDFYLQSHKPLAGTGKSAHYFVIQNDMDLSTDALQTVTHAFCYAYARSTTAVSYCTPAYYADRLCDRGRAYLRHWLTKACEEDGYSPHRERRADETFESYSDEIKDHLRDSTYWRTNDNQQLTKYGSTRRNPWHPNLDDIMFYL